MIIAHLKVSIEASNVFDSTGSTMLGDDSFSIGSFRDLKPDHTPSSRWTELSCEISRVEAATHLLLVSAATIPRSHDETLICGFNLEISSPENGVDAACG
jgi:hypothetical protein